TYYYPIFAEGGGVSGPYQMHIKALRRAKACCQGDVCSLTNRFTCEAAGGHYLGDGDQPNVQCQVSPCSVGSCCLDGGGCNDTTLGTIGACTANPANIYHGGVSCLDFTCPGPIMCDMSAGNQCKEPGGDLLVLSDFGACTRVADDFYPVGASISIEKVCWRGAYHDFGGEPGGVAQISTILEPSGFADCSGAYGDDKFTITIYDDAGGVPGAVRLSESFDTAGGVLLKTAVGGGPIYDYSVTLFPTASVVPGTRYWIEIQNDNGGNGACYWMWESSRQAFNSVSARDDDNNWEIGDVRLSADQSMCLDGPELELDPFDGTVITGACCFDGTGQCLDGVANYDCVGVFYPDTPEAQADCDNVACSFACCRADGSCNDETASACAMSAGQNPPGVFSPGVRCADGPLCGGACTQGTRCCYDVDAGPGCGDPSCCTNVCGVDPFCCDTEWDQFCASEALDLCDPNLLNECLEPPLPAAIPHDIRKNRYISFDPGYDPNNPKTVAFRVSLTASEWHEGALGVLGWVSEPDPNTSRATIGPARVERVWSEPVIHVGDCRVAPIAKYGIAAFLMGADETDEANYSEPLIIETSRKPGVKWWGDAVGYFDGTKWTAPNGTTSIDDAVAAIKTFQDPNAFNATHLSVTDVGPQELNGMVNTNDVFMIILGFQGYEYPYGCPDDPCWDTRPISEGGDGPCPCVPTGGGGSGPMGPMGPATVSTLSLLVSSDLILQGELIDVEVFLDVADDLGGYQLDVEVSGGSTGNLDLEDLFIDAAHTDINGTPDYVFLGVSSLESVSSFWGQVGAVNLDGVGIPVTGPAYLGTFQFRASADAVGVFTIRFADIENNFLMNGQAGKMTDAIADDEAFIGVEVECVMDSHCDDSNACTDDTCNNGTCVYTNDDTNTCSDGNDCTDDSCSGGTCVPTNDDTNSCTDSNDCTSDACVSGVCTGTNLPSNTVCDDGLFCTKTDKCDGNGVCVGTGSPCRGWN
ncbi:MAG: hypothetical protein IH897_12850, partial [Planctomycetes bacterium]|nr:hypothetical protein [Planctomycetota bacterium]